jgi:hypothetical protein
MNNSSSYSDLDDIVNRFLYIVPIGDRDNRYYWEQCTIELTELARKICSAANLPSSLLNQVIQVIFCWTFRNYIELQTSQSLGIFYFENVVVLNAENVR